MVTRDHEVNIHFHDVVQSSKELCKNQRLRLDRKHISIEIYRVVRKINPPRRFLMCPKNNENEFDVLISLIISKP